MTMKIDTQGMSLDLPPEKDPKTGLWLEPKPIENQRAAIPDVKPKQINIISDALKAELKDIINEVLDEREKKR